jgi:ADP-heptose:LPS heptosyltransferase
MGGPEERAAHEEILARLNSPLILQPETRNFRQAAALLKKCHVFLSVDTSLMHVAAAVGVPRQIVIETPSFNKTVEPFGRDFIRVPNPSVAGRNLDFYRYDGEGIKGSREELLQCMASVSPADVWRALNEALN